MSEDKAESGEMDIELPKCMCWQDPAARLSAEHAAQEVAHAIGGMLGAGCVAGHLCKEAVPYVIDQAIINMLSIAGVANTQIEMGTDEAKWETLRLLKGMEERLVRRVELYYAFAKKHDMTAEKVRELWAKHEGRSL